MKKGSLVAVNKLTQLVASSNIRGAEELLLEIANQKGDQEVMAIVANLPTTDVLAIAREGDMSSASILHSFVTPKQFGEMVSLESQHGSGKSEFASKANGMISAIVFGDHVDSEFSSADFIREMFATEAGTKELVKFLLLNGGDGDDEAFRRAQIFHFMQFGNFDFRTEEPEDPEDADLQESNDFCFFSQLGDDRAENYDLSWRHVLTIIMTELDEGKELLRHALIDYKNKLSTAPKVSIPKNNTVTTASGNEVQSAL